MKGAVNQDPDTDYEDDMDSEHSDSVGGTSSSYEDEFVDDLDLKDEDKEIDDVDKTQVKRGPTIGRKQIKKKKRSGGKIEVKYNKYGVPVREVSVDLSTLVGVLARSCVPIIYDDWRKVPKETKDRIWETLNVSTKSRLYYFICEDNLFIVIH